MTLIQDLKQLGLDEKEAEVYLSALELGQANIQDLVKKSGVKRSTVYEMLKNLKDKGLVAETTAGKRRLIIASAPEKLKRNVADKERLLNEILPELNILSNISRIKPKITFYEGRGGLREIYMIALKSKAKTADWVSPMQPIIEMVGEDFMNNYIETKKVRKYHIRSIHITDRQFHTYKYLDPKTYEQTFRSVRFTPKGIDIPNAIGIWDNKVAIMSSKKEGIGFIIESEEFTKSMKVFYEILWDASKSYNDIGFHR